MERIVGDAGAPQVSPVATEPNLRMRLPVAATSPVTLEPGRSQGSVRPGDVASPGRAALPARDQVDRRGEPEREMNPQPEPRVVDPARDPEPGTSSASSTEPAPAPVVVLDLPALPGIEVPADALPPVELSPLPPVPALPSGEDPAGAALPVDLPPPTLVP
jgi:hypothetical protein